MEKGAAKRRGWLAEEYVARYLEQLGGRIRARNYHSRFGEIDIIAEKQGWLLFVEVKARSPGLVAPLEAVTPQKQQKLIRTAELYLAGQPSRCQPRFDVAGVYMRGGKIVRMEYVENAFMA